MIEKNCQTRLRRLSAQLVSGFGGIAGEAVGVIPYGFISVRFEGYPSRLILLIRIFGYGMKKHPSRRWCSVKKSDVDIVS